MISAVIHWACLAISTAGVVLLALTGAGVHVDLGLSANATAVIAIVSSVVAKNPLRVATPSAFLKGLCTVAALVAAALIGSGSSGVVDLGRSANWVGIVAVVLGVLGYSPLPASTTSADPPPPPVPPPSPPALVG